MNDVDITRLLLDGSGTRYLVLIVPDGTSHTVAAPFQRWCDHGYGSQGVSRDWLEARLRTHSALGAVDRENLADAIMLAFSRRRTTVAPRALEPTVAGVPLSLFKVVE